MTSTLARRPEAERLAELTPLGRENDLLRTPSVSAVGLPVVEVRFDVQHVYYRYDKTFWMRRFFEWCRSIAEQATPRLFDEGDWRVVAAKLASEHGV